MTSDVMCRSQFRSRSTRFFFDREKSSTFAGAENGIVLPSPFGRPSHHPLPEPTRACATSLSAVSLFFGTAGSGQQLPDPCTRSPLGKTLTAVNRHDDI